MNQYKIKATLGIICLLYIVACCLSGCRAPLDLAKECAEKYPPRDSTIYLPGDTLTEVIEIPGDTLMYFDTIWRNQYKTKIDTVVLRCPPTRTVSRTIVDTVMLYRENTAQVAFLNKLADKNKAAADRWRNKADNRGRLNLWLIIIVCVLLGYTFRWSIVKIIKRLL